MSGLGGEEQGEEHQQGPHGAVEPGAEAGAAQGAGEERARRRPEQQADGRNDGEKNGDYRGEKASSQLDQRHRLVFSSSWEPKFSVKARGLAHAVGTGWRISQISTFASSQPATPTIVISGVPFPNAAFDSTINGFGGSLRVPFLPASSLDIGQVFRTDARLAKIFQLSDRLQLHVNFEAFNVCNHVTDTAVNTTAYVATNQVLRPVVDLGKGVASQGYPDGTNARRAQVSARIIW